MKLTGAAILVSRGIKVLQAAPAAYPYRSAARDGYLAEGVMKVAFQVFRSQGFSELQVEQTAEKVARFASGLRPDQIITISQILDGHIHLITVWYWEESKQGEVK
jgi:hypothetical protein